MITPVEYRVLVRPDTTKERIGNLIVPDTVRTREQKAMTTGELIAFGPDAKLRKPDGKSAVLGDMVVFAKYSGAEIEDGDKKYFLINDEDILAIIE